MLKMATKKTLPRKPTKPRKQKLIDIEDMHASAKANVITYHLIVAQLSELMAQHPTVRYDFLMNTLFDKFEVTEQWFTYMQLNHKQSIIDSVRGKYE